MKEFKKLFKYIWPQWPSMITIFTCVLVIGILFSASFMTVIPLLKVMMGREGIHGWVDRKVCNTRYGMDFYVPAAADILDPDKDVLHDLRVISVKKNSAASSVGIKPEDSIIAVSSEPSASPEKLPALEMTRIMSRQPADKDIIVYFSHLGDDEIKSAVVSTEKRPFYLDTVESLMSRVSIGDDSETKKEAVKLIIILMIFATFFRCIARFFQDYLAERIVNVSLNGLRRDTFSHIVDMPIGYFSSEGPSDTVSRIIRDSEGAGYGIKIIFGKAIREPSKAIFTLAAACLINWQIVVIFLCGAPFLGLTIGALGKKMKKASRKSLMNWSLMLGKLGDAISGLRAIKVYNRQDSERQKFEIINNKLLKQQNNMSKVDAATNPLLEMIGMIVSSIGLIYILNWVFSNRLDEAEFFTLLILLGTSAESLRKSSDVWNKIQQSYAAAERIFSVTEQPKEKEIDGADELGDVKDCIEFRDVVFTYPKAPEPVLKGISLKVKVGQNIAIVGPNGSGKTTLLNLLPRFYDADSGQILIDGKDITKVTLKSLRDKMAVVSQRTITFNDTIAANIGFGKLDATMDDIIEAAQNSYSHEFITNLPDGYNTIIGEDGAGLSGGQLQRIVIARAILKNPQILIFDEAMSQVDADSESKIYKALEKFAVNRTCFVIAHRFSTVVNSDIIAVADNGRIIATGKHSELIESCQLYKRLYETQLMH